MAHYRIEARPRFDRDLAALPSQVRKRVIAKVETLADEPRPPGVKKLKGADDLYRVRVGDYRIVYAIHDGILLVILVRVRHRKEAYD